MLFPQEHDPVTGSNVNWAREHFAKFVFRWRLGVHICYVEVQYARARGPIPGRWQVVRNAKRATSAPLASPNLAAATSCATLVTRCMLMKVTRVPGYQH